MGFFDSFPYSNQHTLNLDWLIKKQRELEEYIKQYTAVNNVSYAGIWDITKQYPQWAVVSNGDEAYMSNKPVPVGIPIDNSDYWLHLADLDPRIRGIIAQLALLPTSPSSRFITVNKDGGAMYTAISAAVEAAKNIATKNDRVTVCVFRGVYNEQITLLNNPGVDIVGIGEVVINNTRDYPYSTLFTTGTGYFKNIKFNSMGRNTYALHIEAQTDATPGTIIFEGCSFDADQIAGVGIGFGSGFVVEFRECNIYTSAQTSVAAYLHNLPQGNATLAQCLFRGCSIINNSGGDCVLVENARAIHGGAGFSNLALIFQGNSIRIGVVKYNNGSTTVNYIPQSGEIFAQGEGNTADVNFINRITWFGDYTVSSNGYTHFTVAGVKDYYQMVVAQAFDPETNQQIESAVFSHSGAAVTVTGLNSVAGKAVTVSIAFDRP